MSPSGKQPVAASHPNDAANLAALIESASDVIWAVDLDYRLVTFNPAFGHSIAESFGVQVAAGMSPHEVVPRGESGPSASSYARALSEGRFIEEFRLPGGRTLELAYNTLRQDGKVIGVSVFGRDITEEHDTLRALQAAESAYRAVFEGAVLGICRFELDRSLSAANAAFAEILGYDSPEELVRTITPGCFWEDPDGAGHLAKLVAEQEIVRGYECRVKRKDGDSIWVSLSSRKIYRPDGKLAYYLGFLEDISERKRIDESLRATERELREGEEFLRLLFDTSPAFVVATDTAGRVLTMNRSILDALECTLEEAEGRSFVDMFVPEAGRREVREVVQQLANSSAQVLVHESRILSKSGRERLVAWSGRSVARRGGSTKLLVAFGIDITEMRHVEQQFRHAQKMEAVGRLAGGVAHDFNNLLTVINGYSQLALAELRQGDPLRDHLDEIYGAGQRAASLTHKLLAFSRKQVMQPRAIDLNQVVSDMAIMLRRLVGEDVNLALDLAPGEVKAFADPSQIEQVIMNLAVNARDAMPGGGDLTIGTATVENPEAAPDALQHARPGRYAALAVSDTGTGMDEATMSRVFEPFFTTKEADKGTGLGLSMVQGIVAQTGGYVSVSSERGHGATFKVFLPLLMETTPDVPRAPQAQQSLTGNETVLVVEDDAEVQNLVVAVLKSYGYRALAAANPGDALRICEQGAQIDLVLTDMVMPDMSGRDFVRNLKSAAPGIKRAMFMSGYTEPANLDSESAMHFIQKPFVPAELARKVRQVLDSPATL